MNTMRHKRALECLEIVGRAAGETIVPTRCPAGSSSVWRSRALANRAQLILADEPTGELDSKTTREPDLLP